MRRTSRRFSLPLLAVLCAIGAPALADRPPKQIVLDARLVQVSQRYVDQLGLFRRSGPDDTRQLLLSAPPAIDGVGVDRIGLELDRSTARALRPLVLPGGWSHRVDGALVTFTGPPVDGRLAVGLVGGSGVELDLQPKIELGGGGRILLQLEPAIRALSAPVTVRDLGSSLRLPQSVAPGDSIGFVPLDPHHTPGSGDWSIGGLRARWNSSFGAPRYEVRVPAGFGAGAGPRSLLRVRHTDDWGFLLVDAAATDVRIRPTPRPAGGSPRVSACPSHILDGRTFCLCGDFPPGAASQLTINGKPLDQYLVSSGPTILNFELPEGAIPPGGVDIGARSGFAIADGDAILVRVGAAIDRNRLRKGQSTSLQLELEGTREPIDLRLRNRTPDKIRLEGGEEQVVTTSGGEPNRALRAVHAVSPGDFVITYSLAVGSCACAEEEDEVETRVEPPKLDRVPPIDTDRVLNRIEEGRRKWEEWTDRLREIDCRDDAVEALVREIQAGIDALRASMEELRQQIEKDGLDAQLLEGPAGDEARRRLEAYSDLDQKLEALEAHLIDVLLLPRCEDYADDGGGSGGGTGGEKDGGGGDIVPGDFDVVGDPPKGKEELPPPPRDEVPPGKNPKERCGPDITKAFEEAFERVTRRIHELPASERGEGGAAFLRRNAPSGWFDEKEPAWGEDAAKDDHLLWWEAGPILLERCASLGGPCGDSAWLWGHCVPAEQVTILMEGIVEGQLGIPSDAPDKGYEDSSEWPIHRFGRWLGAAAENHRRAGLGDWKAFQERAARSFGGRFDDLFPPLDAPSCTSCEKCDVYSTLFEVDWTNEDWKLSDGKLAQPDGKIVLPKEEFF